MKIDNYFLNKKSHLGHLLNFFLIYPEENNQRENHFLAKYIIAILNIYIYLKKIIPFYYAHIII